MLGFILFQIVYALQSSSSVEKLDIRTEFSSIVVKSTRERDVWSLLYCSGANLRREVIQNGAGRKLISYLDFTNVSWRKNIIAFTLLFSRRVISGSRWWVGVPMESKQVWYCFVFCSIEQGVCTRERQEEFESHSCRAVFNSAASEAKPGAMRCGFNYRK